MLESANAHERKEIDERHERNTGEDSASDNVHDELQCVHHRLSDRALPRYCL